MRPDRLEWEDEAYDLEGAATSRVVEEECGRISLAQRSGPITTTLPFPCVATRPPTRFPRPLVAALIWMLAGVFAPAMVTAQIAVLDELPAPQPVVVRAASDAYRPGEVLTYDLRLRLGRIPLGSVGTGRMEVAGVDTVRGRAAYHLVFTVQGGVVGFKVDDTYESWVDTETLVSLRHTQQIHEGKYRRTSNYEIFPERATFSENGGPELPGVDAPIDDGSFIYLVRGLAIGAGDRVELHRYFKPAKNPVVLTGVRADTVKVPAGRFASTVIRPTIKSGGLFAEGGRAEVWISQDERRLMVQLVTHVKFGSLQLTLRSVSPGAPALAARDEER